MSTPATPRSSGNSTREQLDDLDALLQRMLDLPVNRTEDDAAEPAPASAHPDQQPAEARVTMVESPTVPIPTKHAQTSSGVRPVVHESPKRALPLTPAPSGRAPSVPQAKPLAIVAKPATAALPEAPSNPGPAAPLLDVRPSKTVNDSARWVTLGLESLVALNNAFDRGAERLGRSGRWLQGPRGRAVLGVTGLGLIGLALLILILDWFGWTW
jgi:hypothetical protein